MILQRQSHLIVFVARFEDFVENFDFLNLLSSRSQIKVALFSFSILRFFFERFLTIAQSSHLQCA